MDPTANIFAPLDCLGLAVCVLDETLCCVHATPEACSLLHLEAAKLPRNPLQGRLTADMARKVERDNRLLLHKAQTTGKPTTMDDELLLLAADNQPVLLGRTCRQLNTGHGPSWCLTLRLHEAPPTLHMLPSGTLPTSPLSNTTQQGKSLEPATYRLFLERRVLERTSELTRSNKLLQDKIVELEATKRELSAYRTRLRELACELSLVEQRERRRLALELHDGIGQDLAMARIRLSSLRGALAPHGREHLCDELLDLTKKMIDQSRCLIWEMGSPELYELGFEAAIEELAEEFQDRHGLDVACKRQTPHPLELHQDQQIMLFQMVRELLTNVVKHAQADKVTVLIRQEGRDALCSVSDNGKGFSPQAVLEPRRKSDSGFGLFSIRERLGLIGGSLEIHTGEQGAHCLLRMPLQHGPAAATPGKRSSFAGKVQS